MEKLIDLPPGSLTVADELALRALPDETKRLVELYAEFRWNECVEWYQEHAMLAREAAGDVLDIVKTKTAATL